MVVYDWHSKITQIDMNYTMWLFGRLKRKLWWKAVLYGLLGVATSLAAIATKKFFPGAMPISVSQSAIESLLTIIASSMLSVTTFSLGAMTTAFGSASSSVTPRATQLLMEDKITHNVLSTFIGAFIFSIVSLVVLKSESYGDEGRAVLFVITTLVLGLIVVQLLRWINHVLVLGRMGTTIERVEAVAREALVQRQAISYLGANPWFDSEEISEKLKPIYASQFGYIQFIDMAVLSRI